MEAGELMPRTRLSKAAPIREAGYYTFHLITGLENLGGGPPIEELELAWDLYGDDLMADCAAFPAALPGSRPWAYWRFELDEEKPPVRRDQVIRLAQLGLLRSHELAALEEDANVAKMRIGTGAERSGVDGPTVKLWKAVAEAIGR